MAIKCQYDLKTHLNHIITFLLHPRKLVSIIYFAFLTSSASEIVVYLSSYTVFHRKLTFSENILFVELT